MKKLGCRKLPPGPAEIISVETNTPMSMRVHFPGDASRMLMIDSCSNAEEVMQKVTSKIHLKNPEEFGLFVVTITGDCVPIVATDFILDVLNMAEKTVATNPQQQSKKKDPNSPPFTILCKKKLWIDTKKDMETDMIAVMIYHQVVEDYLSGNILSGKELQQDFIPKVVELGALMMKADSGFDQTMLNSLEFFTTVIPERLYTLQEPNYWRNTIMSAFLKITGNNELAFKKKILDIFQTFSLFGNTFFDIKNSTDTRLPNGGVMAIGLKGISIYDRSTKAPLLSTSFDSIVNFRFDESEFVMKTGDLMNKSMLRLQTKQGFEIADLIQSYIQFHVNKTQNAQNANSKKYAAF